MKELSIEQKAKRYDEAIKKAKDMMSYKEVRQEDKELLLKNLCTRLPYGVKIKYITYSQEVGITTLNSDNIRYVFELGGFWIDCKPYLRPMSSMTGEEEKEYHKTKIRVAVQWDDYNNPIGFELISTFKTFDWLDAHYFDYRGLIKKGLALEAPVDMYKDDDL